MRAKNAILIVLAATVVAALFLAVRQPATEPAPVGEPAPAAAAAPVAPQPTPTAAPESQASAETPRVPPFRLTVAKGETLPRTVPAESFSIPVVAKAYGIAGRIPAVLAQQPCYCYCDKFGHGSLLDCFTSDHGAG